MKRKYFLFLLLFGSICIISCKKEISLEKETVLKPLPPGSIEQRSLLLTTGIWKQINYEIKNSINISDNIPVMPALNEIEDCKKDNLLIFNADYTVTFDNGLIKCAENAPQQEPGGNWALDQKAIVITIDGREWTLLQLDDHFLKMYAINQEMGKPDFIEIETFERK